MLLNALLRFWPNVLMCFNYYSVQVGDILLNVYMDYNITYTDMRIGAFVVLRGTVPNFVVLQAIAHRLRTERNSQLRTFVYTSLVSVSKIQTNDPQYSQL